MMHAMKFPVRIQKSVQNFRNMHTMHVILTSFQNKEIVKAP